MKMIQANKESIEQVKSILNELHEDITVPKNIKIKVQSITSDLSKDIVWSMKISKVLNDLDEIVNDVNLQPHTRTQIWSIVTVLENMIQTLE